MKHLLLLLTLQAATALAGDLPPSTNPIQSPAPGREPVPAWINDLPWTVVVPVIASGDGPADEALAAAQAEVVKKGGGVVYLPAGTYHFQNDIVLEDGVILRGADLPGNASSALDENYAPATRLEFPKYQPSMEGSGTPIDTAFRKIRVKDPATTSNCGVVNLTINRAHIDLGETPTHEAGRNRLVYGCLLTNTAAADPTIPNAEYQQQPHQRFTARHTAAIGAFTGENLYIANNRLPKSADDNFTVKPYTLVRVTNGKGQDFRFNSGKPYEFKTLEQGVEFDYDNRPGIYANMYQVGSHGGGKNGTPEEFPHAFRKGIVIRDNFIYCSGRAAIAFSGDGVFCGHNTIRYPKGLIRPTTTGLVLSDGSATNDNRAVTMRGYRWHAHANDFEVHSNLTIDGGKINDGEGIMHENHHNSFLIDSKMTDNVGNQYLCFWTVPINGLVVTGNTITEDSDAIHILGAAKEVRNVRVANNTVKQGKINVSAGTPENIVIESNTYTGTPPGIILVDDPAWVVGENPGFEVQKPKPRKPRPSPSPSAAPAP